MAFTPEAPPADPELAIPWAYRNFVALQSEISGEPELDALVSSSDPQMIAIVDPEIVTDTLLDLQVGVPLGLVKLDSGNQIPVEHLPVTGLNPLGAWDPDPGEDGPDPPAAGNTPGDFYIFSNAGTMNLREASEPAEHPVAVNASDQMMYSEPVANPFGWYYIPNLVVPHEHDWADITGTPVFTQRWPTYAEVTDKPPTFPPDPHGHTWDEISGKPIEFPPEPHTHDYDTEITGKPATFPPDPHTHVFADITDPPVFTTRWPTYAEVTDKPATFPPDPHTHDLATEITGLTNLISTDAELVEVVDPSIASDTTLQLHVGVPDGLVKLNAGAFVPPEHLPFTGLNFLGEWHPITDGPTPPAIAANGDFYVFAAAGDMTLLEEDNQTPHTVTVSGADLMIYVDNLTSVTGWYYLPRQFPSSIPASAVSYDPQFARWLSTNVQQTLDEISDRATLNAEAESIAGAWRFLAGLEWADVINAPVFTQRWPTYAEVTDKPLSFPPDPHTHVFADITDPPVFTTRWPTWDEVTGKPVTFPPSAHTHVWADITDPPVFTTRWADWTEVTGKPATFPPSAHTHVFADITDPPVFTTRWPTYAEVTDKPATFPPSAHTHTASEIVDLPPPGTVVTRFESAPIVWAQFGQANHGLGRQPDGFQVSLRNVIAQNGYNVNDEIDITVLRINNDGSKGGWASNVIIGFNSQTVNVNSMAAKTGGSGSFTPNNWRVILRAWIYT